MSNILRINTGRDIETVDHLLSFDGPHKAQKASSIVSDNYRFISSETILKRLGDHGFGVTRFERASVRRNYDTRFNFEKHMIRLARFSDQGKLERPEIILINSHDKTSSFQIMGGIFRFVCANGLVIGDGVNKFKVIHSGHDVDNVIEASFKVIDNVDKTFSNVDEMKKLELSQEKIIQFGTLAAKLKNESPTTKEIESLVLTPRRREDCGNDLWSVFNRTQENLVKGYRELNGGKKHRGIKSINTELETNIKLWSIADQFLRGVN